MQRKIFLILLVTTTLHARIAPRFTGDLMTGGTLSLQTVLKKEKPVLLLFWATWCVPCLEELKMVKRQLEKEPSLPIEVVSVNVDTSETSSGVKAAVRQNELKFPVILDPEHNIFGQYFVSKTLPFSVLIDAKGEIRETFNGFHENMFEKVRAVVSKRE